ncbi:MAG: lipopolysaccharide kinase InaA family protein [Planctomycetes bacterium]|nr:lipopolysaccharide kinase InaA family protein [Planctomycetota bacterium]
MSESTDLEVGGARWTVRNADPEASQPEFLQKILDGQGDLLKEVRIKRLLRIRSAGNRPYLVKHYRGRSFMDSLKNFWRGSPALEEYELVLEALKRGIPTVAPSLFGERGQDSWIAFPELKDLIPADKYFRGQRNDIPSKGEPRKRVLRAYGRFARRIHDLGLDQDDFDPNNVMFRVTPDGQPSFIIVDFERAAFSTLDLARRTWLLAKMNRFDGASMTDRLRFLAGYCEGAPSMDLRGMADSILQEHRKVLLRDLGRGARHATDESRNIGRIETGYFRKKIGRETGDGLNDEQARELARVAPTLFGEPFAKGPGDCRILRCDPGAENEIWRAANACLRAALPVLPPLAYGPGWVAFAGLGRDLPEALGAHRGKPEFSRILEELGRSIGRFERLGLDIPGVFPPDPLTVFVHDDRVLFTCLGPLGEPAGLARSGVEERVAAAMVPLRQRFDLTRDHELRFAEGFRRASGLAAHRKAH